MLMKKTVGYQTLRDNKGGVWFPLCCTTVCNITPRSGGGGGQEDGIAIIYCIQSKVKWGGHDVNGGGGGAGPP